MVARPKESPQSSNHPILSCRGLILAALLSACVSGPPILQKRSSLLNGPPYQSIEQPINCSASRVNDGEVKELCSAPIPSAIKNQDIKIEGWEDIQRNSASKETRNELRILITPVEKRPEGIVKDFTIKVPIEHLNSSNSAILLIALSQLGNVKEFSSKTFSWTDPEGISHAFTIEESNALLSCVLSRYHIYRYFDGLEVFTSVYIDSSLAGVLEQIDQDQSSSL